MSKSTRKGSDRPPKPYPDFPLGAHPGGMWQKKILGKIHYFGRWGRRVKGKMVRLESDGWKEALDIYKAQADDLHAGRTPRVNKTGDGLTLAELSNRFLTAKQRKLTAGEITQATFRDYRAVTNLLISEFGSQRLVDDLAADDFELLRDHMAKSLGPTRLGNVIGRVKSVFKYGYEAGIIERSMRYGPEFVKPSAAVLRRHKAKNGERMLEADQLRQLLDAAPAPLKAMLMLGVNCGFIAKDCADLPLEALDLAGGWVSFPRPKTGVPRRCALWPETKEAIKAAIDERPEPRHDAAKGLVFLTTRGRPWLSRGIANPITVAVLDLMKGAGVHRKGIGFATLRHVFRTAADGCRDQVAINLIMGHSDATMAGIYRERIDDERLIVVSDFVRQWLFSERNTPEE